MPDIDSPLHRIYIEGRSWPWALPEIPPSNHVELDSVLAEVNHIATEVLEQSRLVASGPRELRSVLADTDDASIEPRAGRTLLSLHQDHWLAGLDESVQRATQHAWPDAGELMRYVADVRAALSSIPQVDVRQQQLVDELLDVLSLPAWGRRYELYSAWLLTLIVAGVGRRHCTFHLDDGVLSFSFAGSHLASIETAEGRLELWAELRHHHASPIGKGRKKAVQPDYTLTRPPISAAASAVVVVEAKQYARPSQKNFFEALVDYTAAHARATVLLANYGPMSQGLLQKLPDRSGAFGRVRPDRLRERLAFVESIRAAVPPPPAASWSDPESVMVNRVSDLDTLVQAVVVLQWSSGRDLDLHLHAINPGHTTNYQSLSSAEATDAVRLWNDDVIAPGLEVAHVLRGAGTVSVWVHRFNAPDHFWQASATVHVLGSGERSDIVVRASTALLDASWWKVGIIDANGEWRTIDEPSPCGP